MLLPSADLGVMYVRTANSKQDTAGSKTATMMLCFALHICIGLIECLSVCLTLFVEQGTRTYVSTYVCAIGFTWYTLRSGATCLRTCACRCIYRTVGMYVGNNVPIYAIELSNTHYARLLTISELGRREAIGYKHHSMRPMPACHPP